MRSITFRLSPPPPLNTAPHLRSDRVGQRPGQAPTAAGSGILRLDVASAPPFGCVPRSHATPPGAPARPARATPLALAGAWLLLFWAGFPACAEEPAGAGGAAGAGTSPAQKKEPQAAEQRKQEEKQKEAQGSQKPGPDGAAAKSDKAITVVVTASRVPTEVEKTGTSIDVITGKDKETNLDSEAGEMLRPVPGVAIEQTGHRGDFTAIRTRGGESDHTLILYDGFKVNQQGGFFNFQGMDPLSLDRIEIARGPGSTLFGADAMTGTVNVVTKKGAGRPQLTVSGAGGTYQTDQETVNLEGDYKKFAYNVSSAHFRRGEDKYRNSEVETINYAGRFDFQLADQHALKAVFRGMEFEKGSYENSDDGMGPRLNPPDPNDSAQVTDVLGGLEYRGQIFPIWESILRTSYNEHESRIRILPPGTSSAFVASQRFFDRLWRHTWEWQNNVTAYESPDIKDIVTAGYYLEYESFKSEAADNFNPVGTRHHFTHLNQALYLQNRLELYDRAFLTLGARREENNDFGEFWSLRADASILVHETDTRFFGSVGNAFRAPSFFELADPQFGNPSVGPEQNFGYDAGIEQFLWDRRVDLRATWFDNEITDLVEFTAISFNPFVGTFLNTGSANTRGFELFGSLQPLQRLRLEASATLLRTQNDDGDRLLRRAPRTYAGRLVVEPLKGLVPQAYDGLELSFEVFHKSGRTDMNFQNGSRVRMPGYTRGDIAVNYRFLKHFRAFLRVENFTDTKYEEALSFPADGANLLGGLEFQWRF